MVLTLLYSAIFAFPYWIGGAVVGGVLWAFTPAGGDFFWYIVVAAGVFGTWVEYGDATADTSGGRDW